MTAPRKEVVRVQRPVYDAMLAHALEDRTVECCGLLAGRDGVITQLYRGVNVAAKKDVRYEMDGIEVMHILQQIEDEQLEHLGIYHSHPRSRAYPSATDRRLAAYDVVYFVISLSNPKEPWVGAFRIHKERASDLEGRVCEVAIELV